MKLFEFQSDSRESCYDPEGSEFSLALALYLRHAVTTTNCEKRDNRKVRSLGV